MHAYERDRQSGAGNCVCGGSEHHVRHPHGFREAWIWAQRVGEVQCVCSRPKSDPVHHSTDWRDDPANAWCKVCDVVLEGCMHPEGAQPMDGKS